MPSVSLSSSSSTKRLVKHTTTTSSLSHSSTPSSLPLSRPPSPPSSSSSSSASSSSPSPSTIGIHTLAVAVRYPLDAASKILRKDKAKDNAKRPAISPYPPQPEPNPALLGGHELAAQQSGFAYGMSMEDAAQIDNVISRSQQEDPITIVSQQIPTEDDSTEQQPTMTSRVKSLLGGSWSFLPSFNSLLSSHPKQNHPVSQWSQDYVSLAIEPELIPSVKKDPASHLYMKGVSGNVVILGGYRGSVLRDADTHEMLWIPIKVGVGLRKPTLELGLGPEAEEHSEDKAYPSDMVTHIGKLVDMGKRLKDRCAAQKDAHVYTWGYDWRLSLAKSSKKLVAYLEQLFEQSSPNLDQRRGAKVIAHSMGGLVALHALATCSNPRIFEGIVFASTPFLGTPNILGPLRYGDAALFNDTICSPRATFSFRSSFYLLPWDNRCFEVPDPDQDDDTNPNRFKDVDFLDPETWNVLGLSPCIKVGSRPSSSKTNIGCLDVEMQDDQQQPMKQLSTCSDGFPNASEPEPFKNSSNPISSSSNNNKEEEKESETWTYLERTLCEVKQFQTDILQGFDTCKFEKGMYPPLVILTSGRTPSVYGAIVGFNNSTQWIQDIQNGNYSKMSYAPGDGIITRKSSTLLPSNWSSLLVSRKEIIPLSPTPTSGNKELVDHLEIQLDGKGIIESAHRHITLLSDVDSIAKCLEILRRAKLARSKSM